MNHLRYVRDLRRTVTPSLAFEILKFPHVTEKTGKMSAMGSMVFLIDKKFNKIDVEKACLIVFEQKVKKVNIQVKKNKVKRFKGVKYIRSDVKKAIVTFEDKDVVNKVIGEMK